MQLDMMTIDVDGSLKNPIVLVAVLLWGLFLAVVTAVGARWWMSARRPGRRGRTVTAVSIAIATLYLGSWLAEFILGNILYKIDFALAGQPQVISVGFWGGPPVLPAWGIGLLGGLLSGLVSKRKRPETSGEPFESDAPQNNEMQRTKPAQAMELRR
jgi:hypothetical protein